MLNLFRPKGQIKLKTLAERRAVLELIKFDLVSVFGSNIVSAIVYGSTLNEDFSRHSDFDILIVSKNPDINFLNKLKSIKHNFLIKGVKIDFNVHDQHDVPSVRKEVFWHNNRGIYVQKEFELYGMALIGKNVFLKPINLEYIRAEAVKVINSLNYQARKLLINSELSLENRILLMKWCIYGSLYALASREIFPKDRKLALKKFNQEFKPDINPETFLHLKVNSPEDISDKDVIRAYDFLRYLDILIFKEYKSARKRS